MEPLVRLTALILFGLVNQVFALWANNAYNIKKKNEKSINVTMSMEN